MATKKAADEITEPRPTVREAMRFGAFANAKLVAGAEGLDRPIEWVRMMETPEVRPRAGDLMLTTGFPIKDDPDAQVRLVARIAESDGAGLVVRPHPYLRKLSAEMLSEADRLNVPVFTISADVQMIDLMTPLLERIINAEHWRLKRSLDIHRRFTELVLDGKGVNEICRTLAELLESAVVIEDASFPNQVLGYISVLDHPPHHEELAYLAIEQAALVLALAIAKERELAEVEGRVRGEFLEDLLNGTYGDEAAAQRRARHLGYPLNGSHIVMLVDIDDFRGFNKARQVSEDAIQGLKREFLRRVTGTVRASYPRALVQGRSDSVVSLLPLGTEPGDHQARGHALGIQVRQAIADWKPGFTVSVGFSGPTDAPGGIAAAQREVVSVMDSLARFKRWGQVVSVPELGLTGLLAAVTDERLVDYSRRHLGPLMEHDRTKKGSLVSTLRAYLETGEQQQAATRLRVHPNTLRYRLDRIREISGVDLEDPETRLNLAVALRVQALLGM